MMSSSDEEELLLLLARDVKEKGDGGGCMKSMRRGNVWANITALRRTSIARGSFLQTSSYVSSVFQGNTLSIKAEYCEVHNQLKQEKD